MLALHCGRMRCGKEYSGAGGRRGGFRAAEIYVSRTGRGLSGRLWDSKCLLICISVRIVRCMLHVESGAMPFSQSTVIVVCSLSRMHAVSGHGRPAC